MPQFRDPNEKRDFMLNTPIPRLVPKMALPSIAGMLVTSAYNLADTLFVSQLGTDATGAVGVNGSIDLIIMMAGSLLAVGAASLTSRLLGAKQDERAREVLSTCFFLALALGTLVLILGFTYQDKIPCSARTRRSCRIRSSTAGISCLPRHLWRQALCSTNVCAPRAAPFSP